MRYVCPLFVTVVCAAFMTAAPAATQELSPLETLRRACATERTAYIVALRAELVRTGEPPWAAHEENDKADSYLDGPFGDPDGRKQFDTSFAAEYPALTRDSQRTAARLMACGVAGASSWEAGTRDVATIKQRWERAKTTTYRVAFSNPAPSNPTSSTPVRSSTAAAPTPSARTQKAPPQPEDPSGSLPVDCVQLGDRPGVFKNTCDFDVYFTYCGVNPAKGSWVADCIEQKTFGLIDIGANGVQGGFTRAETIYFFECRSPKTPQNVRFKDGGLYGSCR